MELKLPALICFRHHEFEIRNAHSLVATRFIPASLQRMWSVWNIEGFMIINLTAQLVLALASPLCHIMSNFIVILIVCLDYFLDDRTAIFAFGLISNAGCNKSPRYVEVTEDLFALWASFLLIHLGGPDIITMFSLEDNALWLRHLIAQVFTFFYIFIKTLPDNKLKGPILLIFEKGVIKYGERTRALYLANLENCKKLMMRLPNQGDGMDLASTGQVCVNYMEKVRLGFHFLHIFKCLIVAIMSNHSQRLKSREFLLKQRADSAFELMAFELNLLYEVFYTKIMAANSFWGVIVRNVAFYMSVAGLVLFCINKKDGFTSHRYLDHLCFASWSYRSRHVERANAHQFCLERNYGVYVIWEGHELACTIYY